MASLWTAKELCELAGCTYRQLDYWCRTGLVQPSVEAEGSGSRRLFSIHEVRVCLAITLIRQAGVELIDRETAVALAAINGPWEGQTLEVQRRGPVVVSVDLGFVEQEVSRLLAGDEAPTPEVA